MSKIIEGAKQALAFARGEGMAARIHAAVGGPYIKDDGYRNLTQVAMPDHYIVWNWDLGRWDSVKERVTVSLRDRHSGSALGCRRCGGWGKMPNFGPVCDLCNGSGNDPDQSVFSPDLKTGA